MPLAARQYADWKAPSQDGQSLLWPAADQFIADCASNQKNFQSDNSVRIGGVRLSELRRRMRQWIGADDARPLIATGHQTELYHPGVWAKHALINAAAQKMGAAAYYFAVDADAPKHLFFKWPGGGMPITDDPSLSTAEWSGLLEGPTPAHLQQMEASLTEAASSWSFTPAIAPFFDAMRTQSLEQPLLSSALVGAMHAFDWSLGLRHHALLTSPLWMAPPYLALVHHLLANADGLAAHYNAALADYRTLHKIRTTMRPMPDLHIENEKCEVPFWMDDLAAEYRWRGQVLRNENAWSVLGPTGERFVFNPNADAWEAADALQKFLRRSNMRLAPRALTLTLFLRLLVVDQFVHGIGGGRYDQVCDTLIESFFGMEAPKFAVSTATLYFPEAAGTPRVCLPCMAHEGHQLKHRALPEKMQLVAAISELPYRSPERQQAFNAMHTELNNAVRDSELMRTWTGRFDQARVAEQKQEAIFNRELFYPLQSRERLMGLIEHYRELFGV
jgi:hypothetical protein